MKVTVGASEPVALDLPGTATPVIQNLGPGDLYFDADPEVSTDTGIRIPVNGGYEFPRDLNLGEGSIYLIASERNTDVRYLVVG